MQKSEDLWIDIEKELFQALRDVYFNPIFELLKESLYNSTNAVISAINSGKIYLQGNDIKGKFNISISKELSKFSTFDSRSKSFKIKNRSDIPNDILTASISASEKAKRLHSEIMIRLDNMSNEAKERFKTMRYSIDKTADDIEIALNREYTDLGLIPNINPVMKEKMIQQYNKNMNLYIVNEDDPKLCWNSEQVERLRDMMSKSITEGYNKKRLIERIEAEFETTRNKAKFLARQETSLFLSDFRDNRYQSSGIRLYKWSTSNDNRVVGNPAGKYPTGSAGHENHYVLQGKICTYDDDTIYADSVQEAKAGKWKSRSMIGAECQRPGRAFLCRCVPIPIIE